MPRRAKGKTNRGATVVSLTQSVDGAAVITVRSRTYHIFRKPDGNFSLRTERVVTPIKVEVSPGVWATLVVEVKITAELPVHERKRAQQLLQSSGRNVIPIPCTT